MQLTIPKLWTLVGQDMEKWIAQFRDITTITKWSDETTLLHLKAATDSSLWEIFRNNKTLDTALDAICYAAYPAKDKFKHSEQLMALKREEFVLFQDYTNEVRTRAYRWAASAKYTKSQRDSKVEEVFILGLSPEVTVECRRHNLLTMPEITDHMSSLEEAILNISNSKNRESDQNKEYKGHKDSNEKTAQRNNNKWCSYHKTPFHSNEECRRKTLNTVNKENQKPARHAQNLFIRVPNKELAEIRLQRKINNLTVNFILDTGARRNYMSEKHAKVLNIPLGEEEIPTKI